MLRRHHRNAGDTSEKQLRNKTIRIRRAAHAVIPILSAHQTERFPLEESCNVKFCAEVEIYPGLRNDCGGQFGHPGKKCMITPLHRFTAFQLMVSNRDPTIITAPTRVHPFMFSPPSVTAMVQNALFPVEKNYEMDLEAAKRCGDELVEFAKHVRHVVYVSDYIYSDAERYSESTEAYRKSLADIDRRLAKICDTVVEVSAGQYWIHKGELPL